MLTASFSSSADSATVAIDLGERSYPIRIGSGLLADPTVYAERIRRILDDPVRAAQLSRHSVDLASQYTWSTTAARLRRLYSDITARELVRCEAP